nr:MICOS complex subunit MIC13-like isoform X1 [Osmia lignaria]
MGIIRSVRALKSKDSVLLRFAVKTSIVGSIVYITYEEGLWSKPEETAKLYEKLYVNVAPYVNQNVPKEVTEKYAKLPSVTTLTSCAKKSWNKGVMTTMEFIANLPTHTVNGTMGLYKHAEQYIKELN